MQITDAKVIAGRLSKVRDTMKSEGVGEKISTM